MFKVKMKDRDSSIFTVYAVRTENDVVEFLFYTYDEKKGAYWDWVPAHLFEPVG